MIDMNHTSFENLEPQEVKKQPSQPSLLYEGTDNRSNVREVIVGRTLQAIEVEIPVEVARINNPNIAPVVQIPQSAEVNAWQAEQMAIQQAEQMAVAAAQETVPAGNEFAADDQGTTEAATAQQVAAADAPYDRDASERRARQAVVASQENVDNHRTYHDYLTDHPRAIDKDEFGLAA